MRPPGGGLFPGREARPRSRSRCPGRRLDDRATAPRHSPWGRVLDAAGDPPPRVIVRAAYPGYLPGESTVEVAAAEPSATFTLRLAPREGTS